jgi:hypothetical protein
VARVFQRPVRSIGPTGSSHVSPAVAVIEGRVPLLTEALLRVASLSAVSIIRPTNGLDAFLQVA